MQDDDLVICDNHTALHGRTIYLDHQRHFIRVRMGRQPFILPSPVIDANILPQQVHA
jgi:alpha-ketoglutarate-dependent taurine dioxygenase